MSWSLGIKDALEVCKEWVKEYDLLYRNANEKYNKQSFLMAKKACENIQESIEKLDPPN